MPGDPVKLVQGPLAAMEGVFQCSDAEGRAVVLLELPQRERRVVIEAAALRRPS